MRRDKMLGYGTRNLEIPHTKLSPTQHRRFSDDKKSRQVDLAFYSDT